MITEKVHQFFIDNFMLDPAIEIAEADSFLEAGIIDSTGILELISFLEKSFGITVSDHEIIPENLDSFTGINDFVNFKMHSQDPA